MPKLRTICAFLMVSVAALCLTLKSASAQEAAGEVVLMEVFNDAVDDGEPSDVWSDPTDSSAVFIHTDTQFFRHMLDFQNRQSQKELKILENNNSWGDHPTVLFGGQARLSFLAAGTNTADKFSYLGRFPTDFTGKSATDARMLQANAGLTAHVTNSINLHSELLFSDVFTFPDHKQGSLQVRQAYAVFGDLDCCPWYAYIGKKNVSFGDMGTLSPFSQSMVWHYFGALHEAIGVGYSENGLSITLEGINGGRGIRVADSEERGKLNNFAVNALYEKCISDGVLLQLGAGFLLGTIYDATSAEHLDPTAFGEYNSAWDVFAQAQFGAVTLAGEFVTTVDDWPTTAHPVLAYRLEGAYDTDIHCYPGRLSVSWSEGIQGDSDTQFEYNRQLVLGVGIELNSLALLSLEYVRSLGFAPLTGITRVSDKGVKQDSGVVGLTVVF